MGSCICCQPAAAAKKQASGRESLGHGARAGASWSAIGAALGTSKQSAWKAHSRWIDEQARQHGLLGYAGMDRSQTAAARVLAGRADDDSDERTA